ncbi:MAG TPA: LAGLIDADG family homing endonuclease [Candidatus Hodarchaeales archaeon]|nr:LAGLIDADG family homing endonuclease [Candidatus Hodarchaeales archaeon]
MRYEPRAIASNTMQEVSRVRSTRREKLWAEKDRRRNEKLQKPYGKEQIQRKKLNPHYVVGFIDGEGSFSISIGKHKTLKRGYEVRPEFEIEVRNNDQEILDRVLITIGAGRIYDLSYERYGWYPHAKYKITSIWDLKEYLFPFLDKYPPQAKKGKSYQLFRRIVLMVCDKQHLSDEGFEKIVQLRAELRMLGKKAKTFGSREGAGKPLAPWRETTNSVTNS